MSYLYKTLSLSVCRSVSWSVCYQIFKKNLQKELSEYIIEYNEFRGGRDLYLPFTSTLVEVAYTLPSDHSAEFRQNGASV